MKPQKPCPLLIGMPGAGKSTLGALLADQLNIDFIDTDRLLEQADGRLIQKILDEDGHTAVRTLEERILLKLKPSNCVIATGGSIVYSHAATTHLRSFGPAIFIDVSLDQLYQRITDYNSRGIIRRPDQSFEDVFAERSALYLQYADIHLVVTQTETEADVLARLITALEA